MIVDYSRISRVTEASELNSDTATVGATIKIKGDISGKADIFVNGSIEGTVDLTDNDATVETSGRDDVASLKFPKN